LKVARIPLAVCFLAVLAGLAMHALAAPPGAPAVIADPWIAKLDVAVDGDILANLQDDLDKAAARTIVDLSKLDNDNVITMAGYRQFAKYFAQVDRATTEQKATMRWLLHQPHLLPKLLTAVEPRDTPERLLNLLGGLVPQVETGQKGTLDSLPDLTTALLVVWDKPHGQRETAAVASLPHVVHLFNYFAHSKALRFGPNDLPWELAIYVVDIHASEEDIAWANNQYAHRGNLPLVYFDVPYDTDAYLTGKPKRISQNPYTLANILRFGGVCVDQAYFAAEVNKVFGVPATVCDGASGAGEVGHAWIGTLQVAGRRAVWDFNTARYPEDMFWSGQVHDPQTREIISDADVSLSAELQFSSPAQRLASRALVSLADLVDDPHRPALLEKAIDLSHGNRAAWEALANLGADQKLSKAQIDIAGVAVAQFARQQYPEFACQTLMRMITGASPVDHVKALDKTATLFADRPDLIARIRILQGDLLHKDGKDADAFATYSDVLAHELKAGPIILDAMRRVDGLLREQRDLRRLSAIYKTVWNSMPKPSVSAYVLGTPWYQLGSSYAALLEEMGDHNGAQNIRGMLSSFIPQ